MHLSRLRLSDFRNFEEQRLEIPPPGAAVTGDNGQGKSNLLEAIYYLEVFRSFRGAPDDQLIRFGAEVFRIEGRLASQDGAESSLSAAFQRQGRRKKVIVDGVEPERVSDAVGRLGAVLFSPSDLEIVSGPPGQRRRFLDIVLSLSVQGYLAVLQRYRQVLARRNAALREGAPAPVVSAWNRGLVSHGAVLTVARAGWVRGQAEEFAASYARVSGGESGEMRYRASLGEGSADATLAEVEEKFRQQLLERAGQEASRGATVVGPHRDDLAISCGERDLRTFGSGGQRRTAAVALRMVEAETVKRARGLEPLVLLDDVFAELDPGRSERLLAWIEEGSGQVIATAPKPGDFEPRKGGLPRFSVSAGVLREL
ncbi:MAG: DNA replication/repair protein RecF [Longimicrobiaceae bacterium]